MDDGLTLFILAGHVHADVDVRALDLVIERLADVVEQAGAAGHGGIKPQLGGHDAGQEGHLQRMVEHVLAVAGAVTQTPQQLDQLGMDAVHAGFDDGALAFLLDGGVHLAARLLDRLFNARGVDAAVRNQALQRNARHLAAHRLEAGERDGLRCIVDDEIDAGERFDGADVAAPRGR